MLWSKTQREVCTYKFDAANVCWKQIYALEFYGLVHIKMGEWKYYVFINDKMSGTKLELVEGNNKRIL